MPSDSALPLFFHLVNERSISLPGTKGFGLNELVDTTFDLIIRLGDFIYDVMSQFMITETEGAPEPIGD